MPTRINPLAVLVVVLAASGVAWSVLSTTTVQAASEKPDVQGSVTVAALEQALKQPHPVAYLLEQLTLVGTLPEKFGIIDAASSAVAHLTGERKKEETATLVSALLALLSRADDEQLSGHAFLVMNDLYEHGQADGAFFTIAAAAPTSEVRERCLFQLILADQSEAKVILLKLLLTSDRQSNSLIFAGLEKARILRRQATPAALESLLQLAIANKMEVPASLNAARQ